MLQQDEYHDGTVRRFSFVDFEFHMAPSLQASIHRDHGVFYKQRSRLATAVRKFEEVLEIKPECFKSMYEKSRCHLDMALPALALEEAEKCIEQYPGKISAQKHRNACLFELNDFEGSVIACKNTKVPLAKNGQNDDTDIMRMAIEETIGPGKGPCVLNSRKEIMKYDAYRKSQQIDKRPIWKLLKEQGACDVVSIIEEPERELTKLRKLRNQRKKANIQALYVGHPTATDIDYLQNLQGDKRLFLDHTQHSNERNAKTISSALNEIRTYENMLHARMPYYAAHYNANTKRAKEFTEQALFRIQKKTRRETFAHLVEIKRLAAAEKVCDLANYVEEINFNYFPTKTQRVLPRKFEFISEIFNIVAIAYLRHATKVHSDVFLHPLSDQLFELFQVPHLKKDNLDAIRHTRDVFGDKSTYVDPEASDGTYIKYKRRVAMLEKELHNCRHPVQMCYINFELAHIHITQGRMDEPRILSLRIIELADECKNLVWKMLGYVMCFRADLACGQLVTCRRWLDLMYKERLQFDEFLQHFVSTAILLHEKGTIKE